MREEKLGESVYVCVCLRERERERERERKKGKDEWTKGVTRSGKRWLIYRGVLSC